MTNSETATPAQERAEKNVFNPAGDLDQLSPREQEEIGAHSRPNALLIHETIRAEGESELARAASALVLSALAAGLAMGMSLVMQGVLHSALPDAPWRELVSKLGYSFGFLVVVLGRQQLFTENTLTPILPLLYNRNLATLLGVLRLWALVLTANVAAAWIFAAVLAHSPVFEAELKTAFAEVSRHSLDGSALTLFLKGIFAGWLIALMVWLLPAAETGRPFIILVISYAVALGGFSHIVVGSVEGFYLVAQDELGWGEFFSRFFFPTLVGNIIGGVALVGILNFGQVAREVT